MNKRENQILLESLIKRKIITIDELKEFTQKGQNLINAEGFVQTLIKFFKINENEIDNIIAEEFNIPFLFSTDGLQWVNVPNLPDEASAKYRFIPIIIEDLELTVAFVDPPYTRLIELLENTTHRQIVPVIITPSVFDMLLMQRSKESQKQVTNRFDFEVIDVKKRGEKWATSKETAQKLPSANSVFVKLIESALENNVSHIHLSTTPKGFLKVLFRMNGALLRVVTLPIRYTSQIPSMIRQLAKMEHFQSNRPLKGKAVFKVKDQKVNAQINIIQTFDSEKITIKLMDKKFELLNIEEIGLSQHDEIRFNYITSKANSLIVFASPVLGGKTTTLYSVLNKLNSEETSILTFDENEVEIDMDGMCQIVYGKAEKLSVQDGLQVVEDLDFDILAMDKIENRTALDSILDNVQKNITTLSTVQARNVFDALYKLLKLATDKEKFIMSLGGIVAQKFVRKVCPVCGEKYKPQKEILELVGLKHLPEDTFFKSGQGCPQCSGTGYLGIIPLFETLIITDDLRIALSNNLSMAEIKKIAELNKFTDLRFDGLRKAITGLTTLEEIIRNT